MLFWRLKFRKVVDQADEGKLAEATATFLQSTLHEFRGGKKLARYLVEKLLARAQSHASRADFSLAWQDLAHADRLNSVIGDDSSPLLRQRQELVELAVETAEGHLSGGRPMQALRVVAELKRRHILDSRADRIESFANRIHQAELWAAQGEFNRAQQALADVLATRPDLAWVESRRAALVQQTATVGGLTSRLQNAMQASHWSTAQKVSSQLLDIAPHLQLAADALRRSMKRQQPPVVTSDPEPRRASLSDTSTCNLSETDVSLASSSDRPKMKRYMLWVDGVGGFLLCVDPDATIGRALPDSGIEIPILGDLRRRHLRISRSGGDFIATALADVRVGDQLLTGPHLLRHNQRLMLGNSVVIEFQVPHPLSSSARLNLVSRHRTQPWSDAVILVADTLVLGPSANCHIVCPEMDGELILCLGRNGWTGRYDGNIEVDGKVFSKRADLAEHCRIAGDGFSLTLEGV
jgi:hypothetical protein